MFRALNGVMAVLFALSAAVQFNDPDPVRWVIVYALAALLSARVAFGRPAYVPGAAVLALVAIAWAATTFVQADAMPSLGDLFEFTTMRTSNVEFVRETLGLAIVAGWMLVQVLCGRRVR